MTERPIRHSRGRGAFAMLMLYAGKASGVIVNLIFIPLYSRTLGPNEFGSVAVILSLQALLMMLDMGMSTLMGRDIAAAEATPGRLLYQLTCAEFGLTVFYGTLVLIVGLTIWTGVGPNISWMVTMGSLILFALLVLQNLNYSAILARRAYVAASALQLVGNLARAGATAIVLTEMSASLLAFVLAQVTVAAMQVLITRNLCRREFKNDPQWMPSAYGGGLLRGAVDIFRRGRSLALLSAAGAAVTQLDKPIISLFMTPASVAPYYLATTYCMVPMAILAGPVAQYFQPQVLNLLAAGDNVRASVVTRTFTVLLLGITLIPSAALYLLRQPLIELWLHGGQMVESTVQYTTFLLPGLAVGSLGFIPYTLLLAVRDYQFQARLSAGMTLLTLIAVSIAASHRSVFSVCIIYAAYHAGSTILLWARATTRPQVGNAARSSATLSTLIILPLAAALLISQAIHQN